MVWFEKELCCLSKFLHLPWNGLEKYMIALSICRISRNGFCNPAEPSRDFSFFLVANDKKKEKRSLSAETQFQLEQYDSFFQTSDFSHTVTGWFIHWQCFHCVFPQTKRLMFHSEVLYLPTRPSALPFLLHPQPCTCYVGCTVAAQICILSILSQIRFFSFSFATLHVISAAITLVSGVFLF